MAKSHTPLPKVQLARDEERAFWRTYAGALRTRFPDQVVAVRRDSGDVLAVGMDLIAVARELKQRGVRPGEVWVRKLYTQPQRYVL